ncbi:PAS-domain containing protein [Pelagibius marinus]|uniref:PAS-domain containing protein n=1 Tax=Pelagibius marinus TaxID=2762760 RepID=UPI0018721A91|nr:adenylate/guanylate cyclase domain-containing protein [Pelagibius marinus]
MPADVGAAVIDEEAPAARFGIKARLYAALMILAALTVLTGVVAWSIFHHMHRSLTQVAHEHILVMVAAVDLSDLGSEISSSAAALIASSTGEERARERATLRQLEQTFAAHVAALQEHAVANTAAAGIAAIGTRFSEHFTEIEAITDRRLELQVDRNEAAARLTDLHDDLLHASDRHLEEVTRHATAAGEGPAGLIDLLELQSEAEHAVGLLNEALAALDAERLNALRAEFDAAISAAHAAATRHAEATGEAGLFSATTTITGLDAEREGFFALRQSELAARAETLALFDSIRAQEAELNMAVANLVAGVHETSDEVAERAELMIGWGEKVTASLTIASALFALAVMFVYVRRHILHPIGEITGAMTRLAGGDTTVDIPFRTRRDELGHMAKALGVFRDTAIEVQESNLREIRTARRRLSDAIESISEAFSLYDAEDRLVICNEKYRTLLYPGMADEIVTGTDFGAIIRRAVERGMIRDAANCEEEWIADRLARHRDPGEPHMQQRGDGRWIMVSERRTQEGGIVAVYSDITDLKEREQALADKSAALERLSAQLSKYLSPQVYESIFTGRQEVRIASQRKKLTVFLSDIADFTETCDRMESEELTALLNHYLTEMSRIAMDHGATVDKYIGDAILAFFGDPESRGTREDALACVRMAQAMQARMDELRELWRGSGIGRPLRTRMGISTGYCTVGNFGSDDRLDYTIIGGPVNLASRLESAAEPGDILLAYETYALVQDTIPCEELPSVTVKGLAYPVTPYRVLRDDGRYRAGTGRIAETTESMSLDLDPDSMSEEERARAAALLKAALERVQRRS